MSSFSKIRIAFLVINSLVLVIGLCIFGYTVWVLRSSASEVDDLERRSQGVWYGLLVFSLILLIIGVWGCVGGVIRSVLILRIYLVCMLIVLFVQVGLAIFLLVSTNQLPVYVAAFWNQSNYDTRYSIQSQLQCCGLNGPKDYNGKADKVESCHNSSENREWSPVIIYQNGCQDRMMIWLNDAIPLWATLIIIFLLIEILTMFTSCILMTKLQRAKRVRHLDDEKKNAQEKEPSEGASGEPSSKENKDTKLEKNGSQNIAPKQKLESDDPWTMHDRKSPLYPSHPKHLSGRNKQSNEDNLVF